MASMATYICKSPTTPSTSHPQVPLGLPVSHRSIWSSHADLPCRSLTWNKQIKLRNRVTFFQKGSRPERFTNLYSPLRLDIPRSSRGRHLRISSFKGNAQNGELGDKSSKSTFAKKSIGVSYHPQDTNSSKLQDASMSCASQSNDAMPNSQAIHKLFRHWVALLWADSHAQIRQEIIERPAKDVLQPEKGTYLKERSEVSKVVVKYFLSLDASVKIPLLIFVPLYLAVTLVYGPRVSKELAPLWIIGPVIAAVYVKIIQALATLYIVSFTQTVKAWKDFPTYYAMVSKFIADGKLKEAIFLKPLRKQKDSDTKRKAHAYEDWLDDVLGWFSQLFWPVRYRIVKVLKRAKLI